MIILTDRRPLAHRNGGTLRCVNTVCPQCREAIVGGEVTVQDSGFTLHIECLTEWSLGN